MGKCWVAFQKSVMVPLSSGSNMAEKSDKEHRDFYIAVIVGGLGLILILLWLFSPNAAVAETTQGQPDTYNLLTDTMPPGANDYNYNVPPYDPGPPITIAQPTIPGGSNGNCGCSGSGSVACGMGGTANSVNVAQYQTLIGGG